MSFIENLLFTGSLSHLGNNNRIASAGGVAASAGDHGPGQSR